MQEAPHNEKMQYSALFYKELETAQRYLPDYNKVYQVYNHVFQQCLNHSTASAMVHLCGAFAKTDYLLQELQAPNHLARNINDTRVRLRKYHKLTEGELERHHLVDLRNLSTFIAFLYSTKIPDTLVGLFPAEKPLDHSPQLFGECMRIIIDTWDDQYVYGQPEDSSDGTPVKVCYVQNDADEEENWKYLKDLFHRGAQLNLVRPREDDTVFYPELIIYEPDCLINISTVAHCFENYATSPLVDLIKKMAPQPLSAPLIMGNFASQLLDESICQMPASHTYQQSIMEFFKSNALKLLAIGANNEFHQEALSQQRNINRAVHTTLPTALKRFDPKEGLVEPSFFSEMLGMQGRMDYLQSDFKVLIEQKSGKGEFPYDYFITPRHKVDHYVQLLLYMALIRYNYHDIYESNGKELHAFLLYSKYQESLLGLGFAPKLIYQAIKIRNELAWWEFRFSQPDGYRILETLTPEKMNLKKVTNSLWKDHQSKQIADLLSLDIVNVNGVFAIEVAVYNLVFACKGECACLDGVGRVVQRIVREMLEGEVLDADVGVHRREVAQSAAVLERNASAVGECCRDVDGAGRVEVDVLAAHGNGADPEVERTDNRVVGGGDDGVLDEELVDFCLELFSRGGLFGLGLFRRCFGSGFRRLCFCSFCGFGGGCFREGRVRLVCLSFALVHRGEEYIEVRLAVLEQVEMGDGSIDDDGVNAEFVFGEVRLGNADLDAFGSELMAAVFGEGDSIEIDLTFDVCGENFVKVAAYGKVGREESFKILVADEVVQVGLGAGEGELLQVDVHVEIVCRHVGVHLDIEVAAIGKLEA